MSHILKKNNRKTISIIIPVYNESKNILKCYEELKKLFNKKLKEYNYEFLFCDNFSSDDSRIILRRLAKLDKDVKVIFNSRNFETLLSCFNAMKYTSGDAVILMFSCKLQDPVEVVEKFVIKWAEGEKIVQGRRPVRKENFLLSKLRRLHYKIINFLSEIKLPENVGEFQLVDKSVLIEILKYKDYYPYIRGLVAKVGYQPYIIDYVRKERGESFNLKRLLYYLDVSINSIISYSKAPLRVISLFGLLISIISLVYGFVNFILILINSSYIYDGIPTILLSIFFFSGIQVFILGIIAEYLNSIHNQVRFGFKVHISEKINIK